MSESPSSPAVHRAQWHELGRQLREAVASYEARMKDDVVQMQAVIQDAIVTLVEAYQTLEARATVRACDEVGTAAARTALQFEDVLSQLLHRMVERCGFFHPIPMLLADQLVSLATETGPRTSDGALQSDLREAMRVMRMQVDEIQKRDIGQHSMDAGTVELF